MCGVAAYIGETDPGAVHAVWRMLRAQHHRGPDGAGIAWLNGAQWRRVTAPTVGELDPYFDASACVLGHNWLAIQDGDQKAAQPMIAGPLAVVFSGEIYNFVELREDLEKSGHGSGLSESSPFITRSDTEVLLALWRREGPECLARVRGMFAFVMHDARTHTTWAARDGYGIKPLHIAHVPKGVVLASEIRALHAGGAVTRKLRETAALAAGAAGINTFGERTTLYEGVEEVPPGRLLTIDADGGAQETSFASLPPLVCDLDGDAAVDVLRAEFDASVRVHMRSSRRIATCLSGGLDSSNLAWTIARGLGYEHFDAFTMGSSGADADEAPPAAQIARAGGFCHHVHRPPAVISPRDVVEMIVACESPNHVIGPINQFLLLREVAMAGAAVVLDGQGGDELMSGYLWYVPALLEAVRARGGDADALQRQYAAHAALPEPGLSRMVRLFYEPRAWLEAMMGSTFLGARIDDVAALPEASYYLDDAPDLARMRERSYQRGELRLLLRQEDRIGMWHGLECRVPFVDDPLVRAAARIAPETLFQDGYLKHPLRVMHPDIPESVRFATNKRGFWLADMSHFPWLGRAARSLSLESDLLRRLFPKLESEWASTTIDKQWRLFQVAVLERAADRPQARELASDVDRVCKRAWATLSA